jgi:hypothetical protein
MATPLTNSPVVFNNIADKFVTIYTVSSTIYPSLSVLMLSVVLDEGKSARSSNSASFIRIKSGLSPHFHVQVAAYSSHAVGRGTQLYRLESFKSSGSGTALTRLETNVKR